MAVTEVLAQHGVAVEDRAAVFALLQRLPLAARSRVVMWEEYLGGRGERSTAGERATLSA